LELMDKSFYHDIKKILESARAKAYYAVNFAMVEAYWNIGKSIVISKVAQEELSMERIC